jgi:CubicO group peptidase (beta-lactamase class C family)
MRIGRKTPKERFTMRAINHDDWNAAMSLLGAAAVGILMLAFAPGLRADDQEIAKKLQGFDGYMEKVLKDWNAPGVGVGIVAGDRLVFAKGYGYRDYEKKLPFTPTTLCPIASNSKLFTAVAAGMLVEEGKLTWERPVRESVPEIRFYSNELNNAVTLRDMLGHRTGITRHDAIWYKSDFSRKEIFERLQYLEPRVPMREVFLYNNLMYAATGYLIELKTGKTWEEFVRERIFTPLEMKNAVYSVGEMVKQPDHGVPFTEKRDKSELYKLPYYEDTAGLAPAGAIIANIEDVSHWLIALMNEGKYAGKQVLPASVLRATLAPSIAQPNIMGETMGYWEILNPAYGMGRSTASYRGRLLTYHGGDLGGFHSQISFMPNERIGVIVFVIGEHCAKLYNIVGYNVYERLLGMDQTPWSDRLSAARNKDKQAGKESRAKAGAERVPNTKPSHALTDYAGEYVHPAFGVMKIELKDGKLWSDFHKEALPLAHFHYDRFDSPDDELFGKRSINFSMNPQGDIDMLSVYLEEVEALFTRKPETLDLETLEKLAGTYEAPSGSRFRVSLAGGDLHVAFPGQPADKLLPYKGLKFRVLHNADLVVEFVVENGQVKELKQIEPGGVFNFTRK